MIYEELRYRLAGERHLLIELGDEIDLATNFKAIALAQAVLDHPAIGKGGIRAIMDAIPSLTTVLIHYNPRLLTLEGLIQFCKYCWQQVATVDLEVPSRLIEIPVLYNDRWCRACFENYCQTIKPIEDNPELIARLNGFSTVDQLIAYHSRPEWWTGAVGFIAGLPTLMPLDPQFRLQAPKYDPPRTWTPQGTVGVGGGLTTIYPVVIPDGYQMIGRTPVPIFDAQAQLAIFRDHPLLFRLGDRVKFRPICEAEFEAIEHAVQEKRYEYQISEPQIFRLNHYLNCQKISA